MLSFRYFDFFQLFFFVKFSTAFKKYQPYSFANLRPIFILIEICLRNPYSISNNCSLDIIISLPIVWCPISCSFIKTSIFTLLLIKSIRPVSSNANYWTPKLFIHSYSKKLFLAFRPHFKDLLMLLLFPFYKFYFSDLLPLRF